MTLSKGVTSGLLIMLATSGASAFHMCIMFGYRRISRSPMLGFRQGGERTVSATRAAPMCQPGRQRNRAANARIASRATGCSRRRHRVQCLPAAEAGADQSGVENTERDSSFWIETVEKEALGGEAFCDQCGDAHGASELTVCCSPRCGVSFSQCPKCGVEYAGCCSAACQALATPRATAFEIDEVVAGSRDSGAASAHIKRRRRPSSSREAPNVVLSSGFIAVNGKPRGGIAGDAKVPDARAAEHVGMATSSHQANVGSSGDDFRENSTSVRGSPGSDAAAAAAAGGSNSLTGMKDEEDLVESYASRHSAQESSPLTEIREATTRSQPGGAHMVSGHLQGQLLKLLTRLCDAKRVLDIGTFTGYSALAFAEALPEDGEVVTLESDKRAADTARDHFSRSSEGGKIRLLEGPAMDSIDQLMNEEPGQFDVIFIDADKKKYWDYYNKVFNGPRPLLARGGILLADNVLFHEMVPLAEALSTQENTRGELRSNIGEAPSRGGTLSPNPRRLKIAESLDGFNKRVRDDERVEVLMLPLRDGLSVVTWRDGRYPDNA